MSPLLSVPPAVVLLAVAALVPFLNRRFARITAVGTLALVVAWTVVVPSGTGPSVGLVGTELVPVTVHEGSRFVGVVFSGVGLLAVVYTAATEPDRTRLATGVGTVAAALAVVFAGDWLSLAIGWVLLVGVGSVLVFRSEGPAVRAGSRFAISHAGGAALLVAGVVAHGVASGAPVDAVPIDGTGITGGLPALAVGLGIGVGVGAVGLHVWMRDAFAASHVASSPFLVVYTTTTAAYVATRAFPDGSLTIAYLGGAMAVYGACLGLVQRDVRRLLAYQVQAQTGIVLVGFGVGSAVGVAGGFAHVLTAVLALGLAFVVTGQANPQVGIDRINLLGGRPATVTAVVVAALTGTGFPGFAGFVSVGLVLQAVDAAGVTGLRWLLLAGLVGTAATLAKLVHLEFLRGGCGGTHRPAPAVATVVAVFVGGCIVAGVAPAVGFDVVPFVDQYASLYAPARILEATAVAGVGVGIYAAATPIIDRTSGDVDVVRLLIPVLPAGLAVASGVVTRLSAAAATAGGTVAFGAVRCVRDPGEAIERVVPSRWRDRYRSRRRHTIGATGTKLGIEGSVYVLIALMAVGLVVGLR